MDIHILVVDDEPEIADLVGVYLRSEGFTVHTCGTAKEALDTLARQSVDLAILDVMLPDKSGFDLCGELRREHRFPVLMLTAKSSDMDKITGLTIGADDYQALQPPGAGGPGEGPAAAVHPLQQHPGKSPGGGRHRLQRPGHRPGHPPVHPIRQGAQPHSHRV